MSDVVDPGGALERPSIDPRIRARRIEVQRHAGRRRLHLLVDAGLVTAVVLGFLLALRTPLLDVDRVVVTGNQRTESADIAERSGIERGDQLADVDLRAAGERIAELPWVDRVALHRRLDGQVDVAVTERIPVAIAGPGLAGSLIDADGRVLGPLSEAPELAAGLVVLVDQPIGLEPGSYLPEEASDALVLARSIAATSPGLAITLSTQGEPVAALPERGEVRFGDTTQLESKVRSLRTVLEQVDLTCVATIDLSVPGSPVLTREEGCS